MGSGGRSKGLLRGCSSHSRRDTLVWLASGAPLPEQDKALSKWMGTALQPPAACSARVIFQLDQFSDAVTEESL